MRWRWLFKAGISSKIVVRFLGARRHHFIFFKTALIANTLIEQFLNLKSEEIPELKRNIDLRRAMLVCLEHKVYFV